MIAGRVGFASRTVFSVWLAVLVAGGVSCWEREQAPPLVTATIGRGDLEVKVSAPGRLKPAKQVTVKSKAAGEIVELLVEAGQEVVVGQVLIRLDKATEQARLDRARAEHRAAEAATRQSKLQLDREREESRRVQGLFEEGLVAAKDFDAARRSLFIAEEDVVIAKSREEAARFSLKEAEDRYGFTEIRSPLSGVALEIQAPRGQVVSPGATGLDSGTPLIVIADLSKLVAVVEVEETEVGKVVEGQTAQVKVDAFPGETFPGVVEKISPQAIKRGPVTVIEVEIGLTEMKGARLRPGMTASAEILVERRQDAVLAPVPAVLDRGGPGALLVIGGTTVWRPVKVGPSDWSFVAIEHGLTAGDVVALPGAAKSSE